MEDLAIKLMWEKSKYLCKEFIMGLKRMDVKRVWVVISDAYRGIEAAVKKKLVGTGLQRQ